MKSNLLSQSSVMFNKTQINQPQFCFKQINQKTDMTCLKIIDLNQQVLNKTQILKIVEIFRTKFFEQISLSEFNKLLRIFQVSCKYYENSQIRRTQQQEKFNEYINENRKKLKELQTIVKSHNKKRKDLQQQLDDINSEVEDLKDSQVAPVVFMKCQICGRKQTENNFWNHVQSHKYNTQQTFQPKQQQPLRQSVIINTVTDKLTKEFERKFDEFFEKQKNNIPLPQRNNYTQQQSQLKSMLKSSYMKDSVQNMNQMFNNFQNLFDEKDYIGTTKQVESRIFASNDI